MSVERINEGTPWWAKTLCGLALFGFGYGAGTVAGHEQAENLEAVIPTAQASVDAEREKRYALERRLHTTEESLTNCMADRSILQAVQGVNLPRITATKASR